MMRARTAEDIQVPTLAALWSAALAVAMLGTSLLFSARAGVNWPLITLTALLALLGCARLRGGAAGGTPCPVPWRVLLTGALAQALAIGAAVCADPAFQGVIAITVTSLLANAIALTPLTAPAGLGLEFLRRLEETVLLAASSRWRPLVRGVALALPVVGLFGLMLAPADPLLAAARDRLGELLTKWDALLRVLFFGTLFVLMGGACGLMVRRPVDPPVAPPLMDRAGIGAVERIIVLGGVTILFAGFLALQFSYLFGDLPRTVGSGVTFAEYARRGFAELTIVASLCVVLIVVLDHGVSRKARGWRTRAVELALLGELVLLLVSACRRRLLYEDAYGFTTARLYGQGYMVWLTATLCIVGVELRRRFDGHRMIRRAGVAAVLTLVGLIYWNHEAWIVERNVARFAATRQFDARYVVWSLSLDAVPAVVAALDALPPDAAQPVRAELQKRYPSDTQEHLDWYEWNLRRNAAQQALSRLR